MQAGQPGYVVQGPPSGLPAGRHDVPRGVIAVAGGVVVLLGVVYLVVRWARRRRQAR